MKKVMLMLFFVGGCIASSLADNQGFNGGSNNNQGFNNGSQKSNGKNYKNKSYHKYYSHGKSKNNKQNNNNNNHPLVY